MKQNKHTRISRWFQQMYALGFSFEESYALRRIEMTLRRWAELECGNSNDNASYGIERDETTGKPFMAIRPHSNNKVHKRAIADREKGALKRLGAIMANHPTLWAYHQGDPRGCALYVGRKSDLKEGQDLNAYYSSYGICANHFE